MYEYPVSVEFEDIDYYGIVHHPKYLLYFERARVHFFKDNGINLRELKFGIVLRKLEISYKIPLVLMDEVVIQLRAKNIDKYRFEFDYQIKKDGKLMALSTIEMVTIDLETKRVTEIPDGLVSLLKTIEVKK